jgi:hypothetical protein
MMSVENFVDEKSFFSDWSTYYNTPNFNSDEFIKRVKFNYNSTNSSYVLSKIPEEEYTNFEHLNDKTPFLYQLLSIDYNIFYSSNYNIEKVINDENLFFENHPFVDNELKNKLIVVKNKYIKMISDIFNNEHLIELLDNDVFINIYEKNKIFTPIYIINLFKTYNGDENKINTILNKNKNEIKEIFSKLKKEMGNQVLQYNKKKFDVEFQLNDDNSDYNNYKCLIVNIIKLLLLNIDELINNNVCAIYRLVSNLVNQNKYINLSSNKITYSI